MTSVLPFLSKYDPPGTSEGSLDPLGLYQVADQLAVDLVPAVRERMQRVRFLTAMTIGSLVTEDIEDTGKHRDVSPTLVWEWLVVEALIRSYDGDAAIQGTAGAMVTRRAIKTYNYLDANSYLKTPRIFGFNGVYKRLAIQLGLVDVHLGPGQMADQLKSAWAKDRGLSPADADALIAQWRDAVLRSISADRPRTNPRWTAVDWRELADAFAPEQGGRAERKLLRSMLLSDGPKALGALPQIWELYESGTVENDASEQEVLAALKTLAPHLTPRIDAIVAYERFARALTNAYDAIRICASRTNTGVSLAEAATGSEFKPAAETVKTRLADAVAALEASGGVGARCRDIVNDRFSSFREADSPTQLADQLILHHEGIQKTKSAEGKRPWFDRLGGGKVHIRLRYRLLDECPPLDTFVHTYRAAPISRFHGDLR